MVSEYVFEHSREYNSNKKFSNFGRSQKLIAIEGEERDKKVN